MHCWSTVWRPRRALTLVALAVLIAVGWSLLAGSARVTARPAAAAVDDSIQPWENLGGSVRSLVVARNSNGRLELFAVWSDGTVRHDVQSAPNGPFTSWGDLGGSATSIAVGTNQDGRLELFAVWSDGTVRHNVQSGPSQPFTSWGSLGGTTAMAIAVGQNADGRLEVFAVRSDHTVWHNAQSKPNQPFTSWGSLGGSATSLAVGKNSNGRMELFAVRGDHTVWHNVQSGANSPFTSWGGLGGSATSIAVGTNQDGRLELFTVGSDGTMQHNAQSGPSQPFTTWGGLGGTSLHGTPDVERNLDGRLEVFAVDSANGTLQHIWQGAANSPFGGWQSLDGSITSMVVGVNSDGRLEVFGTWSGDQSVRHIWQTAPGVGWAPYSELAARSDLMGRIGSAAGAFFGLTDDAGNTLDCMKVIQANDGSYLAVYHNTPTLTVKLAVSSDLVTWHYVRDLDTVATQAYLAEAADHSFVLADEVGNQSATSGSQIHFLYYPDQIALLSGTPTGNFTAPNLNNACNQGTPDVHGINGDASSMDVGFHYNLCGLGNPDSEGFGTLTGLNTAASATPTWTATTDTVRDAALDSGSSANLGPWPGSHGARDDITWWGWRFSLQEAQAGTNLSDMSLWRPVIYDYTNQTAYGVKMNAGTNGPTCFANPHITPLTSPSGTPVLVATFFVHSPCKNGVRGGEMLSIATQR